MRLIDLQPHWVGLAPGHAIGLTFLCPDCVRAKVANPVRIGVLFDVPIGGEILETLIGRSVAAMQAQLLAAHTDMLRWRREGETFDTVTLMPSIDTSKHGHWHGFITRGEMSALDLYKP